MFQVGICYPEADGKAVCTDCAKVVVNRKTGHPITVYPCVRSHPDFVLNIVV